ncbi:MAG: saccharopine dehydrogenase NADP-binding domain-containing protein [Lachnospiraceae bacterium]|nr:saccharopine dehydrogenase NADP-binding domain-containing protein [Lachnospiraceae bacterium]
MQKNIIAKKIIIGLGAVGKSFLRIIKENDMFHSEEFYCIDYTDEAGEYFTCMGGRDSHYISCKLERDNYESALNIAEQGDYILDFAINVKNLDMLDYCMRSKIHYLSLADASWFPDPAWINTFQHYKDYRNIRKNIKDNTFPTCIVEFGMNPGLVSCFMKQCIDKIIEKDESSYISKHREGLKKLLEENKYNEVAMKIGLKYVVEIDNDNQQFNVTEEEKTVYSPWCPFAYHMETLAVPEIYFGTKREFYLHDYLSDCDHKDYFVALTKTGITCREDIYSPQGKVNGFLSTHEEIFSMGDYLRVNKYKPTVYFVYSPCELAEKTALACMNINEANYQILNQSDYLSGGESIGVILQGKRFKTRYFGNYLSGEGLAETATVLQVSASAYAAYKYMLEHPDNGLMFPEDLPHRDLLNTARRYLKEYIDVECPSISPQYGLEPREKKGFKKA